MTKRAFRLQPQLQLWSQRQQLHRAPTAAAANGATATALYDYEAGEENELSFPENAVIANVVSCRYCPETP